MAALHFEAQHSAAQPGHSEAQGGSVGVPRRRLEQRTPRTRGAEGTTSNSEFRPRNSKGGTLDSGVAVSRLQGANSDPQGANRGVPRHGTRSGQVETRSPKDAARSCRWSALWLCPKRLERKYVGRLAAMRLPAATSPQYFAIWRHAAIPDPAIVSYTTPEFSSRRAILRRLPLP